MPMIENMQKWAFLVPKLSREMSDYYCGILDHIKSRPEIFLAEFTYDDKNLDVLTEFDGLITYLEPPDTVWKPFRDKHLKIPPTITISFGEDHKPDRAYAQFDVKGAVQLIVDNLKNMNCQSYAFCFSDLPFLKIVSQNFEKEFRDCLRENTGVIPETYQPRLSLTPNSSLSEVQRFIKWARDLKHPCGLLVHTDDTAHKILDSCRLMGIKVPEEIRIISTGNSPIFCERTFPTLTSYDSNHLKIGSNVAKALLEMIEGRKTASTASFKIPLGKIVKRASTMDSRGCGRISEAARKYIQEQIRNGKSPSIKEIAFQLKVSRTKLNSDFKIATGHTIHDEISEYRLTRMSQMLKSTNAPVQELAKRNGFATFSQATRAFKKRFGTTMSEYRQA